MRKAIVTLCKALNQIINAHSASIDRETAELLAALATYSEKYGE